MSTTGVSLRFEVHGEYGILAKCEFWDDAVLVAQRDNAPYIDDISRGERFYRKVETIVTYKQEG